MTHLGVCMIKYFSIKNNHSFRAITHLFSVLPNQSKPVEISLVDKKRFLSHPVEASKIKMDVSLSQCAML
jgi:hypothetical protein